MNIKYRVCKEKQHYGSIETICLRLQEAQKRILTLSLI